MKLTITQLYLLRNILNERIEESLKSERSGSKLNVEFRNELQKIIDKINRELS